MKEQMEVKLIGAEIVRLSLQPQEVVVVLSWNGASSREELECLRNGCIEAFGVQTIVLHSGMELKALLNLPPECQEIAARARREAAEKDDERFQNLVESLAAKKEPANA